MMSQYLIISEVQHLLITSLIALLLYWRYRDWRLLPFCFFFGFLIDIDHWFDYFAYLGFEINLTDFFNVHSYMKPSGKIYVPFHSWEFLILFWFIGKWAGKKFEIEGLEWAITLPYFGHLFWDFFSFHPHPLAFSFIYRFLNNFSLESYNLI